MRLVDGIKLGSGLYIGWAIGKAIENVLVPKVKESKIYSDLTSKLGPKESQNEDVEENRIIGFHAE